MSPLLFLYIASTNQPPFLWQLLDNVCVHKSIPPSSCPAGHSLESLTSGASSASYTQWGLGSFPPLLWTLGAVNGRLFSQYRKGPLLGQLDGDESSKALWHPQANNFVQPASPEMAMKTLSETLTVTPW